MKVHSLLVGLDNITPVEKMIVVYNPPREVRLEIWNSSISEYKSVGKSGNQDSNTLFVESFNISVTVVQTE